MLLCSKLTFQFMYACDIALSFRVIDSVQECSIFESTHSLFLDFLIPNVGYLKTVVTLFCLSAGDGIVFSKYRVGCRQQHVVSIVYISQTARLVICMGYTFKVDLHDIVILIYLLYQGDLEAVYFQKLYFLFAEDFTFYSE